MSEGTDQGYGQMVIDIRRDFGLSDREARFVMELMSCDNATEAYRRAGYSAKTANVNSAALMAKHSIQAATARLRAEIADRAGYRAEEALKFAADVLRADPRELVEYRRGCCRFCHGKGHLYQRSAGEMESDRKKHEAHVARRQERNKEYEDPGFNEQGGAGFDASLDPHPECPDCAGEGIGRTVLKDTRNLSREAVALFAGVKATKDGIEVKMQDKAAMLDKMFRYHGLYEADNKQKAADAADPVVLAALGEAMERSRLERQAIMERRAQKGFTGD